MREIVIVGGGASGMAAAIAASADEKQHITLLERQGRVGRKLLSTGNGRCNLTNTGALPEHYSGGLPDFVRPALNSYPPARVLAFFRGLGLDTVEEYGGRVYPRSDHAGSVLDVLRFALERPNLTLRTDAAVTQVQRRADGTFVLTLPGERLTADRLIIACGGCAGAKLGGVRDGYRLLEALGHRCTALYPALTAIRTVPDYPRALKGIRTGGTLRLRQGTALLAETAGDILFTDVGVSGTAAFALSRAVENRQGLTLALDFFPDTDADTLIAELRRRRALWPDRPANQLLTGALQSRLGQMLCKSAGLSGGACCADLTDADLTALTLACKDFRLPVTGVSGFDAAQVTAGGADTAQFDPETLQSRLVPGLYACGEVLDVDGPCGGYNLQWAWASGLLAGELR